MRPDEARVLIALLPEELRDRADMVRRVTNRHSACERCRPASETMALALTAAQYDDLRVARDLLDDAEHLVAGHRHGNPAAKVDRNLLAGVHGEIRGYVLEDFRGLGRRRQMEHGRLEGLPQS